MTTAFAAFGLDSPITQAAAPFVMGQLFKEGEIPVGYYAVADLPNVVITPLCYWNDGSVKMARIAGRAPVTGGTTKQVNILKTVTAQAAGTLLTAADIAAAVGAAGVISAAFSGIGTVSLSSLVGSPQLLVSTREMVECYYHSAVGSDASLYVEFYVRLFADGRLYVNVPWNNSYLGGSANAAKTFTPTITIGGVVVYNNGGASVVNSKWAGANMDGWIGGDPQVVAKPDTAHMQATKLVPNKGRTNVSAPILSYLNSINTYTPYARCGFSLTMGATGYQDQIGVLTRWDSLYLVTRGHRAAYDAVIANARAIYGYAISYADPTTRAPIKIADYATWSLFGAGQGGADGESAVTGDVEYAHHPEAGIFAYMITSDFYFLRAALFMAKWVYLCNDINSGTGLSRYLRGQNRARAWGIRTVSFAAALVPDFMTDQRDLRTWFKNMAVQKDAAYQNDSTSPAYFLGLEDMYNNRNDGTGSTTYAGGPICAGAGGFEHDFNSAAWAQAVYLQPCDTTGMAATVNFAKYLLQFQAGRLGGTGVNEFNAGYCVSNLTVSFRIDVPTTDTFEPVVHGRFRATNWGQVWQDTFRTSTSDTSVNPTTNVLTGLSGAQPTDASGYYGNMMMAISAGVDIEHDFGVTIGAGMQAGFNRLIGMSNYASTQGVATYDEIAQFADRPRNDYQQTLTFTPTGSNSDPEPPGAIVTTPGPSSVFDAASLLGAGSSVFDTHRGLGVPLPEVPTGGTGGTCSLRDMIEVGDNPLSEIRWAITRWPTLGTLVLDGVGGWNYTGAADSFDFEAFVDGASLGTRTVTISAAGTASTITGVTISPTTATGAVTFTKTVSGTGSFSSAGTFSKISGGGSIDPSTGALVPPAQTGSIQTIVVRATSTQDPTKWAEATITIAASTSTGTSTVTSVVVSPSTANVAGGATQTFTHVVNGAFSPSQAVTRSSALGSINSSGVYTAPVATGSIQVDTITITSTQDATKSGTATVTIAAAAPSLAARTVTLTLGDTAGVCANLTGIKVAFYDEPSPELQTTARYQSAVETTDASGVLTFSVNSTLAAGGIGCVSVLMADGRNYLQPQAVS